MRFDLTKLNNEQLQPVLDTQGAVLVTAGAGSGKTRLLTHRIAHIASDLGVAPYNILAITFTNKASREMKERLFGMVENGKDLKVSTIHSLCVSILRSYIHLIGFTSNFSIYDEDERKKVLKKVVDQLCDQDETLLSSVDTALSKTKNNGLTIEQYAQQNKHMPNIEKVEIAVNKYARQLKDNNALDFDDLLVFAYQIIKDHESARNHYQTLFRYIHVDEFQDTNIIQYRLIKLLAGKWGNIFVVGDEDQSIYGWRGANIANIRSFIDDFNPKIYKLEQNYRSSASILQSANELIKNNTARIEKKLWTSNDNGEKPIVFYVKNESEEADIILQTVKGLHANGISYSDMAVLMRVNALSRIIEQKFLFYGVPYKLYGGFKFFDRKEVKDILAYLKAVANPLDDEACVRMIMFPKKGIGETSLDKMVKAKDLLGISLTQLIMALSGENQLLINQITQYITPTNVKKLMPLSQMLSTLLCNKHLKPSQFTNLTCQLLNINDIFNKDSEEGATRLMNISELINSMLNAEYTEPELNLTSYIQQVMLYSEIDDDYNDEKVNLATIHSAKGLEYKVVFIIGLEERMFPLARSCDDLEGLEEERRLMYVAITRAKQRLFLSHVKTRFIYGRHVETYPSRFLTESGLSTKKFKPKDVSQSATYGLSKADTFFKYYTPPAPKPIKPSKVLHASQLTIGQRILHNRLGEGTVKTINVANNEAQIHFDSIGTVAMALSLAPIQAADSNE